MQKPNNSGLPGIKDMASEKADIGESSGFQTHAYIDKKGTPYGSTSCRLAWTSRTRTTPTSATCR